MTPTCWIVTEGIAGTENQCLGVAEALGITPEVKRIRLRFPWKQLSPWLCFGHRFALGKGSDRLDPPYPDLLIASGRKAIGLARHIRRASKGKTFTVVIQDPRIDPRHFDLVVVPQHDPTRGENVIVTRAALHRVTPQKLVAPPELPALPAPRVAVLIGGNSKAHRMTPAVTEQLCRQLMELTKNGATLLVTASRRTGEDNAKLLRARLRGPKVHFWDGTGENPYFAYLAASTHIIVTEDSVSMTSEALSTGKPVYTARLEGGAPRLDKFHALLREQRLTRPFDGQLETWSYPVPADTMDVAQKILNCMEGRAHNGRNA